MLCKEGRQQGGAKDCRKVYVGASPQARELLPARALKGRKGTNTSGYECVPGSVLGVYTLPWCGIIKQQDSETHSRSF